MSIASISALPAHIKGACVSGSVAVGSAAISVATTVEVLQGLAALIAIGSGAYSFYLAFRHKSDGKKKGGKKRR